MFYISADRETPPWISRIIQEDDIHIRHKTLLKLEKRRNLFDQMKV